MNCKNCPQYKRVCDGIKSNKKYCFYYHGHRGNETVKEQTVQFDDLFELINILNSEYEYRFVQNKFKLDDYGEDYFILILYWNEEEGETSYPMGYIYTGGNTK
jgi:hypothetical protein